MQACKSRQIYSASANANLSYIYICISFGLYDKIPWQSLVLDTLKFFNMKNFAVAPFALPFLFMLALGQSPLPTHVIGFTNQAFHAWGLDIAIDGGCVKPEGT